LPAFAAPAEEEDRTLRFAPFSPEFRADPYRVYAELRRHDPVHWCPAPAPGFWFATRYADVAMILKEPRFGREVRRVLPPEAFPPIPERHRPLQEMVERWFVFRDPPDHTRLRGLVNRAFTPRTVESLRPHIQEIADSLVEAAAAGGTLDVVNDYAFPLTVTVIAQMLGVPPADRERFKAWANELLGAIDIGATDEITTRASRATVALEDYLRDLVGRRRREPRQDLISSLIAAEQEGDRLTEEELLATCILLLFGGHETTKNVIGNGAWSLLGAPAEMERLRRDPELMRPAFEELMRYESPLQMAFRYVMEDTELGGRALRRGQMIWGGVGAANRDPACFDDPDRLDVGRAHNPHLGLGRGIHFCVGASLARAEGTIALATLLRRLQGLRLLEPPAWRPTVILRGLASLRVGFDAVG
jgi:pimeloyl-[acyl-carrier protein] synthase